MAEIGDVLTVGEVRALLAQLRETANELEARLEGRADAEVLGPLTFPLPRPFPPIPPALISCWPRLA